MNKRVKIIVLSVAAALLALFIAILFLSLPLGAKGSVISIVALYVTGIVVAAVFLSAAVFFLLHRHRGLTRKGKRVYDNKIKGADEKEVNDR